MGSSIGGKRWPEDFHSRFFIGMHTVDSDQNTTIPGLLSEMDGREIIRRLADAGVDTVYFYASCHCGNCFYPTAVPPGRMHSGLKGRDVFGEAADESRRLGLAFVGVYEFMHLRLADTGPREWKHYYPEAGPTNGRGLCWNTGYGEFVARQIDELAARYPMAGMYVDMLNHPGLVCCAGCARRFREDVGVAPPRRHDEDSLLYKVFWLWAHREEARCLREYRGILQARQPDATMINNTILTYSEDLYHVAEANDYISHDPGSGFGSGLGPARLGAEMAIYQAMSRGKAPFEILHDPIVLGGLANIPPDPYHAVTSVARSRGAADGYPSAMLGRTGRLPAAGLALARRASEFKVARRPWRAEGEPVRFAGLYLSQETMLFHGQRQFHSGRHQNVYRREFDGAFLMLQQEHLPVDVLTRRDLRRLAEFPVVVLPNALCMSDGEADAFREYVRQGGTLVASYRTSLCDPWERLRPDFALGDVFGVRSLQRTLTPFITLLMPLPDGLLETEDWEGRIVSLPGPAQLCETRPGARSLVMLHDRYRRDPAKRASCLHNIYPCVEPAGPAVVENRFGRGRCVYFSGSIFEAYLVNGIPALRRLAVRWAMAGEIRDKALIRLDAPASVEMTAWAQPDRSRLLVHLVNYQSAPGRLNLDVESSLALPLVEDVLPVHDLVVHAAVRPGQVRSARLRPAGEALPVEPAGDRVRIRVPRIHIHDIVELELEPGACPVYPDSQRVFEFPDHDLRAAAAEWLRNPPPGYDPKDDGALSFDRWRPAQDYLLHWQAAGPYMPGSGGLAAVLPPESGPESEVAWLPLAGPEINRNGCVEMCSAIGNRRGVVGYARTYLRTASAQRARFWLGNNDACLVFLNGQPIYRQAAGEQPDNGADRRLFEADLRPGVNTLLVKVEHIGHGMAFFLRIEDPKAPVEAAESADGPWHKAGSAGGPVKEWSGRGEGQI